MVTSPPVAHDLFEIEFRKATIVAIRETKFQLSTTLGALPVGTALLWNLKAR